MAKKTTASTPVLLRDVCVAMEEIAPLHLAESWDNVGLLTGNGEDAVRRVLLAIDLTPAVAEEAIRTRADLLIVYHPPIFKAQSHFRSQGNSPAALAAHLAAKGTAVYSPHTALDTAPGGTNDALAAVIGARVTGSFSPAPGKETYLKLVTFVPEGDLERVADALFAAGAGKIGTQGQYEKCSFRVKGHGTFQGSASTNPTVGEPGRYEHVPEVRFETILNARDVGAVVDALRRSHSYEEPAFDLLRMETPPETTGLGRYAELPTGMALGDLAEKVKLQLGISAVQVVGKARVRVRTLALVAGSAGLLGLNRSSRPYDCLITGELKHHDMLAYAGVGKSVLCLGHSASERPVLAKLRDRLKNKLTSIHISVSRADADPFTTA